MSSPAELQLNNAQARLAAFNALRDGGSPPREAGIAAFPELPADIAAVTPTAVPQPTSVDSAAITPGKVSSDLLRSDLRTDLALKGVSRDTAVHIANEATKFAPETATVVEYKKAADAIERLKVGTKMGPVEQALANSDLVHDMEIIGATAYALVGNAQQSVFGMFAGESASDVLDRLWPDVDVRDDDGTVERKAVVPLALKAAGNAILSLGFDGFSYAMFGERKFAQKAEEAAVAFIDADYRDDMLTGQEVVEYWMTGHGLFAGRLPDKDTPEREVYDAVLREEVAANYTALADKKFGGVAMMGVALGGALGDVFADPTLLVSGAPGKVFEGARKVLPVSSRARMTGAIATRTGRLEHIMTAYNDAQEWVSKATEAHKARPTIDTARQLAHARKRMVTLKSDLDAFAAGPSETFVLPTSPRIHPDHIRPVHRAYHSVPYEQRKVAMTRFISSQLSDAKRNVKRLEKAIERARNESPDLMQTMFTPEQMGTDIGQLEERLKAAITHRDAWKETQRWAASRVKNPGARTSAFLDEGVSKMEPYQAETLTADGPLSRDQALSAITENIKRAVAQGVPEEEIIQWEHTYSEMLRANPDVMHNVVRSKKSSVDVLVETTEAQRRRVLSEDPTPLADFSRAEGSQVAQRVAYGPDQREVAAEAARVLAAGGEIDDVAFHGTGVDLYNSSYGEQLFPISGTEARAVANEWLGTEAFGTRIEAAQWQQSMAEKFGDFFARGLYPETWNIRPPGMLFNVREPMRVLQSVNPKLYTRVHNALNAQKFELTRMNEFFGRELKILGVYTEVNGSYVLNPENSRKFYDIMNMVPSGEKYDKALMALSEAERRSLRRIRQELDFMGDKLGLRNTDKYLEGYIDHVWDRHWNDHGARMQEIRGLGASTDVHSPHLMKRDGNTGYVHDLALSLDSYARAASRKLHFEPMYKDLDAAATLHLKTHPGDEWFRQYVDHMINNFKGRPSTVGQWVDLNMAALNARLRAHQKVVEISQKAGELYAKQGEVMGTVGRALSPLPGKVGKLGGAMQAEGVRIGELGSQMAVQGMPLYNIGDASRTAMGVTALIYSSVLGGSGRYFPMAVATGMATTGSRYGVFNTLRGILTMSTSEGRALAKASGLDKQWVQILEDAAWTKIGKLATNSPTFNGLTVLGPSISATENYIRGWTFHAAMGDMMRKHGFQTWKEVTEAGFARAYAHEALRITEEVNHLFGQLGKPPTFHRFSKSGSVAVTQFLSFIPKQAEELLSQTMKNPGKIAEYVMISGYLQRVAAKAGLDMSDYVGSGFLPGSPDEASSISMEVMISLLDHAHEMAALSMGEGDATQAAAAQRTLSRNLQNFLPYAVAVKRGKRTMDALRTGSLYADDTGKLLYEYDLGGFEWDESKSVAQNLVESYNPKYLRSEEGTGASEIPALRSGLNSPKQAVEREHYRALKSMARRRQYRRSEIARALEEMVNKGDGAGFNNQMRLAEQEGMIPPDLVDMVERSGFESAVPRLLIEQLRNTQSILDSAELEPEMRAKYELRYFQEGQ